MTQYLKDLYDPRGLAYPSNDDDDEVMVMVVKTQRQTLVTSQGKGTSGDSCRQIDRHKHKT